MPYNKVTEQDNTGGMSRLRSLRKQAAEGDPVCAEYLSQIALNTRAGGGFLWIETQLDMEEESDDFRPY